MKYTHLDLFSGIGGFALAARWAGIETVQFVEIDPFCQKVLAKNFKGVPIHDDIETFTYTSTIENDKRESRELGGTAEDGKGCNDAACSSYQSRPFLITGGFPCQPFSFAGKRRGKEDDRHLWPEMLRVIREARPNWVIGENVSGFITMGLDDCIASLEAEGYTVQPFIIPACAVNAPHRRDRVWIVGNSTGARREALYPFTVRDGKRSEKFKDTDSDDRTPSQDSIIRRNRGRSYGDQGGMQCPLQTEGSDSNASDSRWKNAQGYLCKPSSRENPGIQSCTPDFGNTEYTSDSGNEGLQGCEETGNSCENGKESRYELIGGCSGWQEPWIEAATRLCGIPNGLSAWLDENWGRINGKTSKTISRQEVSDLWDYFQSDEIQRNIRGQFPLLKEDDLFAVLCKLKAESEKQVSIPFESKAIQEGLLREMQKQGLSGCPPQGWEHQKQQPQEHKNAVSQLSYEIALGVESIIRWHKFDADTLDRVNRLKALGNSIVPQIAYGIMKAILEVTGGKHDRKDTNNKSL